MSSTARQPRAQRRKGTEVRLTERDHELLLALSRFRAARTLDLVRLCFGDIRKDTAAARLRRLFDSGYVAVHSDGISKENVYMLATPGRRIVEAAGERPGRIPRGTLEHHLAVVSVWVSLATLPVPGIELVRVRPDWELREQQATLPLGLIPDLLAILNINGKVRAISVEVDLGSESIPVLRSKLSRYGALQEPGLILVVYAPEASLTRAKAIRQVLEETCARSSVLWTGAHEIPESVQHLLTQLQPPLTAPPYSDGTSEPLTETLPYTHETTHGRK